MGAPTNIIGIARQQTVFAVKETTKGTLAFPAAADPFIVAAGYVDMNQNPSFSNSEEIRNSRDVLSQFQDMTPAGSFSLPLYVRPAGTAGSAPMGDVALESLLGTKTVNSSTSVVYSPGMTKPSFSLWAKKGHTMFFASGAVAEQMSVSAQNKGGIKLDLSGSFLRLGWAGRDAVAATASAAATTVTVNDAKKYTIGAVIQNVTKSDHGTNGYTVTAVNTSTNVLTISPALPAGGWAISDVLEGYLPAGTDVGTPLESRKTTATVGGVSKVAQSISITYGDQVKMLDDEMTTTGYPADYVESDRSVSGTMTTYFRQDDVAQFVDGLAGNNKAVVITFGDTAGSKLEVSMPKCKLQVPKVSTSAPTVNLSVDYTALGTNGEDSIALTFK